MTLGGDDDDKSYSHWPWRVKVNARAVNHRDNPNKPQSIKQIDN